jgi:di/tricarboxylate transporter
MYNNIMIMNTNIMNTNARAVVLAPVLTTIYSSVPPPPHYILYV